MQLLNLYPGLPPSSGSDAMICVTIVREHAQKHSIFNSKANVKLVMSMHLFPMAGFEIGL